MDRKQFLTRLGGVGLLTMTPLTTAKAFFKQRSIFKNGSKEKIVRDAEGTLLQILGNPQRHKVVGDDTDNQIFEWVDELTPGSGIPPHVHTKEDEIFRVLKGEVELMVDGKTTLLKKGDMIGRPNSQSSIGGLDLLLDGVNCKVCCPAVVQQKLRQTAGFPA